MLCPLVPAVKPGGRPAKHARREILNALAYWLRAGCAWRLLPHDLPPWQTVYHYWRRWQQEGVWERMLTALRERERVQLGRDPLPSAAIVEVVQRRDGGFRSTWAKVGAPPPAVPLFSVVPRRWVVERTFAWLGRCRRLSKDYEYLRVCSENAIYLTMAMLLVRRLARSAR
ncbi:transposase [Streptomyces sp. NPDC096205]|uniref:transposase n=1 Tax=Streptomyces sp. NPDC096205 TaxID=3366081 RepID=UPI003830BA79